VVGRVVDQETLEPLSAAFVAFERPDGQRLNGVLTRPDGRFVLRAPSPGRYRLVAQMIGYAAAPSGYVDLEVGETVQRDIEVPVRAIDLDGIRVTSATRCRARPGSGPGTARLWEEARKALEVASWVERSDVVRFQGVHHQRVLDPGTLRVVQSTEAGWRRWSGRSPYTSLPAEQLAEHGYVLASSDRDGAELVYYAPDANVLLSDSFLDSHCFWVAPAPRGEPELIGLAFEPVRRGGVADIRGVLWLDRGTAELRRLDFTYTDLPQLPATVSGVATGRVEFDRLATGVWIVRRWRLRMPAVELRESPTDRSRRPEAVLVGVHETGAEVRTVTGADGRPLSETSGAVLFGTVVDSRTGQALAGAVVDVLHTGRTATTGEDGAFRIGELSAGVYEVAVSHHDLDIMGLGPEVREVEVEPGTAARLPIDIAPTAQLAAEACAGDGWTARTPGAQPVLLYGVVAGEDGLPVPNAHVQIAADSGAGAIAGRAVADGEGIYRVCVDASDVSARLSAAATGQPLAAAGDGLDRTVSLADAGFLRADLVAPLPPVAEDRAARRGAAWENALIGTIIAEGTRAPVVGATVTLVDSTGAAVRAAVTDQAGRFRFEHPDRGAAYAVRAEHVAFAVAEGPVRFERSDQVRIEVLMSSRAIELEPIVVTERRRGVLADAGFYERQARGMGVFVEVDDARRQRVSNVADMLTGERMIRVVRTGAFGYDVRIVGTERVSESGFRDCQPAIYMDGMLMRSAGEPRTGEQVLSDIVSSDMVAAVEVFRRSTEIPPRFSGAGAACGVVLVWTR
jgi:protocatechuate 3,4-dioxygenase beta subunit